MRFKGDAPIRRPPIDLAGCAKWIGPQMDLRTGTKRAVHRRFEVQRIVDERVGAEAGYMLRKSAVDNWSGSKA